MRGPRRKVFVASSKLEVTGESATSKPIQVSRPVNVPCNCSTPSCNLSGWFRLAPPQNAQQGALRALAGNRGHRPADKVTPPPPWLLGLVIFIIVNSSPQHASTSVMDTPLQLPPIAACSHVPIAPGAQTVLTICDGVDTTKPPLQRTRPQLQFVGGESIADAPRVHQIKWTLLQRSIAVHITSDWGPWDDCWPRDTPVIHCPRQQLLLAKLLCELASETVYRHEMQDTDWVYDAPEHLPWPCRRPLCTAAHLVQPLSKEFPPADPSVSLYFPTALKRDSDYYDLVVLARAYNLELADCATPTVSTGATDTFPLLVDDLWIFNCKSCGRRAARLEELEMRDLEKRLWQSRGWQRKHLGYARDREGGLIKKEAERADKIRLHRTAALTHLSTPDSMPTRVYDTTLRRVVSTEGLKSPYLCISHRWGELDEHLEWWLQDAAHATGLRYVWIDTKCVIQDDKNDKAAELPKMRDYYAMAACVAVILPRMAAKMRAQPASKESVFYQATHVHANFDWLLDFSRQEWLRRIWTFQEATLARNTVVFTPRDVVNGAYVELLLDYVLPRGRYLGCLVASLSSRLASSCHVRSSCHEIHQGNLYTRRQLLGTASADPGLEVMRIATLPLKTLWRATANRVATDWHDLVYGLLGMMNSGDSVCVNYDCTLAELLGELFKNGHVGAEIMLAPTVSHQRDRSWAPQQLQHWIDVQSLFSAQMLYWDSVDALVLSNGMLSVKALRGELFIEKGPYSHGLPLSEEPVYTYSARLRLVDAEVSVSEVSALSGYVFEGNTVQFGLVLPIEPDPRTLFDRPCYMPLAIWICCTEIAPGEQVFHRHHASMLTHLRYEEPPAGFDYQFLNKRAETMRIGGSGTEAQQPWG